MILPAARGFRQVPAQKPGPAPAPFSGAAGRAMVPHMAAALSRPCAGVSQNRYPSPSARYGPLRAVPGLFLPNGLSSVSARFRAGSVAGKISPFVFCALAILCPTSKPQKRGEKRCVSELFRHSCFWRRRLQPAPTGPTLNARAPGLPEARRWLRSRTAMFLQVRLSAVPLVRCVTTSTWTSATKAWPDTSEIIGSRDDACHGGHSHACTQGNPRCSRKS